MTQLELSLEKGAMTNELAKMLMLLVDKIAKKSNFRNYSYLDDMKGEALVNLSQHWAVFNMEFRCHKCRPGDQDAQYQAYMDGVDWVQPGGCDHLNPFAYYTSAVYNSFKKVLRKEKTVRELRDIMLNDEGVPMSNDAQTTNSLLHKRAEDGRKKKPIQAKDA